ncbi:MULTISPECIES: hypothetical protein [Halorussus]|uniref:hypothetical protein n=1 Tax=Halorussus TaxID=1070314 RepID=UPI000E21B0A8|nr:MULTISPECIES: hypothetical protein [Halorussus]NHN61568.1 hypothetical protein [Halorussus sp. JP-T4]
MAASDSPPIGLAHPTVNPESGVGPADRRTDRCACNDCDYTVETGDDLPPKCPDCGGALIRFTS